METVMSKQGLEVIDHTVQLTHEWINELAERLDWSNHRNVFHLLRLTLTGLRDLLGHDEAAQFSAQLPILIRGVFYEGWRPSDTPLKDKHKEAFVARIDAQLAGYPEYRGEEDVRTVFKLLNGRISEGEVEDIRSTLPSPVQDFWPG
jgi:uncharacterized protein (DUF2267 family)